MPNTFELIASSTVGAGGAASIDFTSIPSTFTDLVLKISARTSAATTVGSVTFNGTGTGFTGRRLFGDGSSATSSTSTDAVVNNPSDFTSNTFANAEIYIPNYAGSTNKSFSIDGVSENNATLAYAMFNANLWSNTAAINRVTITPASGTLVQHSTAYLYGVKNA